MAKWSLEWENLVRSGRCPNGDRSFKFSEKIKFIEGAGSQVKLTRLEAVNYSSAARFLNDYTGHLLGGPFAPKVTVFRDDSCFTCDKCHGMWPVFKGTDQIEILGLANTRRTADWVGDDDYVQDNRSSGIPMSTAIKISRRWLQRLEVQWGATKTTSTAGKFSFSGAGIEQKVEQSLKTSLSMSEESERLLKQTVDVMVPPRRLLTVRLHWKQIWQEGDLRCRLPDGTLAEIPYRAAIEMRFDQENIEG